MLPGPAGRRHKVGHRSAALLLSFPTGCGGRAGSGARAASALRQPARVAKASSLPRLCGMQHLYPQPQFPHLYCGRAASRSQHKGSTGPFTQRWGRSGPQWDRSRRGLHSTRDDPWGSFSANAGEGTCKLFVLALWAELGRLLPVPASRKPRSCHTSRPSWASLGTSTAEPRSPCSGTEAGARALRRIPELGACLQGGRGIRDSPGAPAPVAAPLLALGWELTRLPAPSWGPSPETDLF